MVNINVLNSYPDMKDNYLDTFDTRGDLYNKAAVINPHARLIERQIIIDLLKVEPHHIVCDAPAGGGYLAEGLRALVNDSSQIICIEPSLKFSEAIDPAFTTYISPLERLPLKDGSIDRVCSLAGLHHLRDKSKFCNEACRVLKTSGILVIGDVLAQTPVARFLNGPVDIYTTTGHQGLFLQAGECSDLLWSAGCTRVMEEHRSFYWQFQSIEQMVKYCQSLFGLVKATEQQVYDALACYFNIENADATVKMPWSLIYSVGIKDACQ